MDAVIDKPVVPESLREPAKAAVQDAPASAHLENQADGTSTKKFISKGHRAHNEITYRGIDWLMNSTVGVAFAQWSQRTSAGKKYFSEPCNKILEGALSLVLKGETLRKSSQWGTTLAGIMIGGFTIIPPMMYMENKYNKKKIIRWMDEKIYGRETVATDPRFEEAYRKIDEEPNKGFWTGMLARGIALVPIVVLTVEPHCSEFLTKQVYDRIGRRTQQLAAKMGIKPLETTATQVAVWKGEEEVLKPVFADGALKKPAKGEKVAPSEQLSNSDFLHRTIGFDFGLTILYALIHEAVFKGLAAMGLHGNKPSKKIVSAQNRPATPSPANEAASGSADPSSSAPQQTMWAQKSAVPKPRFEKAENFVGAVDSSRTSGEQPVLS